MLVFTHNYLEMSKWHMSNSACGRKCQLLEIAHMLSIGWNFAYTYTCILLVCAEMINLYAYICSKLQVLIRFA